jgi:hypothetical protein
MSVHRARPEVAVVRPNRREGPDADLVTPVMVVDGSGILNVCRRGQQGAHTSKNRCVKPKHPSAKPSVSESACQGRCDESADPRYDEPLPSAHILQGVIDQGAEEKWCQFDDIDRGLRSPPTCCCSHGQVDAEVRARGAQQAKDQKSDQKSLHEDNPNLGCRRNCAAVKVTVNEISILREG